jgi:hypothetical protein
LASEPFSAPPFVVPETFLSERSSVGSVDWPPIESTPFRVRRNVRRDDGTGVQVSDVPPRRAGIGLLIEDDADHSTSLVQKTSPSPVKDLEEFRPDHTSSLPSIISFTSLDRSLALSGTRGDDTQICAISCDPLRNSLSTVPNGELQSTGNVQTIIRNTFDLQSVMITWR